MRTLTAIALIALAGPVLAQGAMVPLQDGGAGQGQIVPLVDPPGPGDPASQSLLGPSPGEVRAQDVKGLEGTGAEIRGLDKVSGDVTDLRLRPGETKKVGRLEVTLGECRYPEDNPTGEAFAWLDIKDPVRSAALFDGWMVASSPALNALDHPRWDVWVMRCTTT